MNFVRHLLLVVALLYLPVVSFAQAVVPAPGRGGRGSATVISPEIDPDRRVTFRLRAPNAHEVQVTFGGSSGGPPTIQMTRSEEGIWAASTDGPMPPDLYNYSFVVDGTRFPDPSNLINTWASNPSGAQAATSVLLVPGVPWSNANGPHGAVAKHVYDSSAIGASETYYVFTPPGYDPRRKTPYPILVVLHGLGNNAQDWIAQGGANLTLDTLITGGQAVPMILVSPAGYGNAQGNRGAAAGFPNFTKALLEEILPRVEAQYNVSNKAADRAITGLSMGAAQSLLLLNNLDKFQWIGSFSPGFDMFSPKWGTGAVGPTVNGQRPLLEPGVLEATFPRLDATANSRIRLLYLTCGTVDDHLGMTRQFKAFLDARRVKVTNYSEPQDVQHVWRFWREQLAAFAPMLFVQSADVH